MNAIFGRMIRALSFDERLYLEIAGDPSALTQAGMIVLLSAVARVLGLAAGGPELILLHMVQLVIWWIILSLTIWTVGHRLFPPLPTDYGASQDGPDPLKVARVLGFAMTPRLFRSLAFLPAVGLFISYAVTFWQIALMFIAVRSLFGYSGESRAIYVVAVGLLPLMVMMEFLEWLEITLFMG
jgi:hypothetical protein